LQVVAAAGVLVSGLAFGADANVLVNEDFTRPLDANWSVPEKWKVTESDGYGWSKALVYENDDPNWYAFTAVTVPAIKPLMKAEASFKVKTEKGFKGDVGAVFEWNDASGKYAGGAGGLVKKFKDLVPDTQGFVTLNVAPTEIPSVAASTHLSIYVTRGSTGKVVFDDVVIRLAEVKRVGFIFANTYQDEVSRGDLKVSVCLQCSDLKEKPKAVFSYTGADGKKHEVAPTQEDEVMARLVLPVTELALGKQTVGFRLVDAAGAELGKTSVILTRTAEPTKRKVRFDEYGRTIVNGKPFFPNGMMWTNGPLKNKGALEAYAQGPFNCLQSYNMKLTREELDAWWKYGLMVAPSFSGCYGPTESGQRLGACKSMEEEEQWVTEVVNRLKDHPALLAWYTCDEFSVAHEPRLRKMNDRIHRLDPDHPTWICLCDPTLSGPFANAYDCIGLDPYPVANPFCGYDKPEWLIPERGCVAPAGDAAETMRKAMDGMRPMWHLPQAFAWKWNFPKRPELRFPTIRELSNMTWQLIADGASGIIQYSYGEMFQYEPTGWQPFYTIACAVGQQIKDNYDKLVALPGPKAENVPATVRVRTWKMDDGTISVLVVNRGNDPVKGAFTVPGKGEVAFDLAGLEVRWY